MNLKKIPVWVRWALLFACIVTCWLGLLAWRESLMGPPDDFGDGAVRCGGIGRDRADHFVIWEQ